MDQDTFITPADGLRPEDAFKGQPMTRRLCVCRFQCPLCRLQHECHLYISLPAADLDEYVAQLRVHAANWELLQPAVSNAAVEFHRLEGDLHAVMGRVARHGIPPTEPPTLELTSESAYTCDHCSRTFDTVKKLRRHMRRCA